MCLEIFCQCFESEDKKEQRLESVKIDRSIRKDKVKYKQVERILLLGASASGKSTILKQMRILHGHGYMDEQERIHFFSRIHKNIFDAIKSLIEAMQTRGMKYEDEEKCEECIDEMAEIDDMDDIFTLSDDNLENIKSIWQDAGIQKVYEERNLFQLIDSAKYFLDSIDRIRGNPYIPSIDDVLRVSIPTSGWYEYSFKFAGIDIQMIDIGGAKTERSKWIHCFENVSSILFLASLSEYDQKPTDDKLCDNGLNEARSIFRSVLNIQILRNVSVILFLNKVDLFNEKIQKSDIGKYFDDYNGPIQNAVKAKKFILEMFLSDNPYAETKTIYHHYTCATDTKNIRVVFDSIKDTVLAQNLCVTVG